MAQIEVLSANAIPYNEKVPKYAVKNRSDERVRRAKPG